jgi:hypothetical protein
MLLVHNSFLFLFFLNDHIKKKVRPKLYQKVIPLSFLKKIYNDILECS